MRKPRRAWVAAAVGGLTTTSVLAGGSSQAAEDRPLTMQQIAALPNAEQQAILNPLRAVARAVFEVGTGSRTDIYTGLSLNPPEGTVDVYVTDADAGKSLVATAKTNHPDIDATRIRLHVAPYTRAALEAGREKLLARKSELPYHITKISVPYDGAGLEVGVVDPALVPKRGAARDAASAMDPASLAGVPAEVHRQPSAGAAYATRGYDEAPFAAGSFYYSPPNPNKPGDQGAPACSAGIPVQYNTGNYYGMITAAHCAQDGDLIYAGGGVKAGVVTASDPSLDASVYSVSSARPAYYKGDHMSTTTYPIGGWDWSWNNDLVCNGGYTTRTMCNIQVYDDNTTWELWGRYGIFSARGVFGVQIDGLQAGIGGDSGGPVYALPWDNATAEIRGTVSGPGDGDGTTLFWVEAPAQFGSLGVRLAS